MGELAKMKIVKKDERSEKPLSQQAERSELRLLSELIERNPERAREFLARLSKSMEVAA